MSICSPCQIPEDAPPIAPAEFNKNVKYKRGGFCTLMLVKCSVPVFDETVLQNWQDAVNDGDAWVLADCGFKGSFGETATTATVGCNARTIVTNRSKTLTIIDQRDTDDLKRAEFWRWIQENPDAFRVAAVTHDGVLYHSAAAHLNPLNTVDEDTNGFLFWTIEATWTSLISPQTSQLTWSPNQIVIPECIANLSIVGPDLSGDYTFTATASGTSGVASITSYAWSVNGVPDGTKTLQTETFTGLAAPDEVTVVVTMVLVNGNNCQATQTYKF